MLLALKSLHILALLLGGASTIGGAVMQRALQRSGHTGPLPAPVALAMRVFPMLGLIAIVTLWITGIWMYMGAYQGLSLGIWFHLKLALATVILGGSVFANMALVRAARGGPAPNPKALRATATAIRLSLILAIILAVLTFS